MNKLILSKDKTNESLCNSRSVQLAAMPASSYVSNYHLASGLDKYRSHGARTAIPSPEEFMSIGIAQIVNECTQTFSCNGDGLTRLVNTAIQIVEESYVVFPRNNYIEQCLQKIVDHSIGYIKATDSKGERAEVSKLVDALDEYGFTLTMFHGKIAETANLKFRVLSRLLLVNSIRPILDTYNKIAEIDYERLEKINVYRNS